jgi:hypothetical protein
MAALPLAFEGAECLEWAGRVAERPVTSEVSYHSHQYEEAIWTANLNLVSLIGLHIFFNICGGEFGSFH